MNLVYASDLSKVSGYYDIIKKTSRSYYNYMKKKGEPCAKMWMQYYRVSLQIFGTNTKNHIEAFFRSLKRQTTAHMSLSKSISTVVEFVRIKDHDRQINVLQQVKKSNNPNVINDDILNNIERLITRLALSHITEKKLLLTNNGYNMKTNTENNNIVYVKSLNQPNSLPKEINI